MNYIAEKLEARLAATPDHALFGVWRAGAAFVREIFNVVGFADAFAFK